MIDSTTGQPITIFDSKVGWSALRVSGDFADSVKRVLDAHGIRYRSNGILLVRNGGPAMTTIDFFYEMDVPAVQAILDAEAVVA